MIRWTSLMALAIAGTVAHATPPPIATMATPTMTGMIGHRRVLVIAAARRDDPQAVAQRAMLDGWHAQAADRDISVVEVSGAHVTGTTDAAADLRRHYRLSPGVFQVVLVGKDGHVALRAARPTTADRLQAAIDAMPMRQAGER